ncbi:hypothetical protein ABZP36_013982 [Zizania latifolia]
MGPQLGLPKKDGATCSEASRSNPRSHQNPRRPAPVRPPAFATVAAAAAAALHSPHGLSRAASAPPPPRSLLPAPPAAPLPSVPPMPTAALDIPVPFPGLALAERLHPATRARARARAWARQADTASEQPRRDPPLAVEVARLSAVRARLRAARSLVDKLRAIDAEPRVTKLFGGASDGGVLAAVEPRKVFLLKCLVAAGRSTCLARSSTGTVAATSATLTGAGGGRALRQSLYSLADLVGNWSSESEGVVEGEAGSGEMELLRHLLKFLGNIDEFHDCTGRIVG